MAVAVGLDAEEKAGLMANAGVRLNGPLMSSATAVNGQAPRGRQQADDWGYR
jgi:hypothetical protein